MTKIIIHADNRRAIAFFARLSEKKRLMKEKIMILLEIEARKYK
jgi:hypothetical protein